MPKIQESFKDTRFTPDVIRRAFEDFLAQDGIGVWSVTTGTRKVNHDSLDEALTDYRGNDCSLVVLYWQAKTGRPQSLEVTYTNDGYGCQTVIACGAETRVEVERVINIFAEVAHASYVARPERKPKPPTVFIGHGGHAAWRDLKDHLHDQHGYAVEAYETGSRAGHTIRDILANMTKASSFAVLVMTGEDEQADGSTRARQNVVHEVGLFQGALGFDRAIVLLENGTDEFSNLHGIQQVRFDKGRIRETFGDVLATLRREFPSRG